MNALTNLWQAAYQPWAAAMREERIYDADVWMPAYEADAFTPAMHSKMDRLTEARFKAEDAIFSLPALNAHQLAMKLLIAFDDGRDANGFMPRILNDCRRFADDSLTRGRLSEVCEAVMLVGNHRGWMREHVAAIEEAVADPRDEPPGFARAAAFAQVMLSTPAVIDDDVIAKMVVIIMEVASGGSPGTEPARSILREAIAHFGLGTTADFEGLTGGESR